MRRIKTVVSAMALAAALGAWAGPGAAQQQPQVWIQIEAHNSLRGVEARLRDWSAELPDVTAFALASGWYAVALGPFPAEEAAARLDDLRASGAIPRDSFIADGRVYRSQIRPAGAPTFLAPPATATVAAAPPPQPEPAAPQVTAPAATEVLSPAPAVETLADARRAEAALSREGRQDIQRALQWAGVYSGAIDGAFGAGTRAAISAWQTAQGDEATGVLSSAQREALVGGWQSELAAIGLERMRDDEAGIEIDLPMGLVAFDRYTPPFAQYASKGDSGVQIWLISQPGDQDALYGLYDLLQSLAIMPPEGPRNRRPRGFEMAGANAETETFAQAELNQGRIRGFLITARSADATRTARILQAMKASFRPYGERVLDPGLVPLDEATRAGLLAGVAVRRPERAGSGFYADARGQVLTAAANVEGCSKITLDGGIEASVVAADAGAGVALLRPAVPLAPAGYATLANALPMAGTNVAVAGFSFGIDLPLPSMTFGRYEAATALDGSDSRARLSLPALAGDAGGPVLGADGLVIGVLQPRPQDPARVLPAEVSYIAPSSAVLAWLAARNVSMAAEAPVPGQMAPEDLTALGTAMAVQVACWK